MAPYLMTVLSSQGLKASTMVYTPGTPARPHPIPKLTMPIWIYVNIFINIYIIIYKYSTGGLHGCYLVPLAAVPAD